MEIVPTKYQPKEGPAYLSETGSAAYIRLHEVLSAFEGDLSQMSTVIRRAISNLSFAALMLGRNTKTCWHQNDLIKNVCLKHHKESLFTLDSSSD